MGNNDFNQFSKECHERSQKNGFYDCPVCEGKGTHIIRGICPSCEGKGKIQRNIGEQLMLVVSELSEALEADRLERHANLEGYDQALENNCVPGDMECKKNMFLIYIKDTFEDEIADTFIRLFDLCGSLGIDIERHIREKIWYNNTRPYKHGKKY